MSLLIIIGAVLAIWAVVAVVGNERACEVHKVDERINAILLARQAAAESDTRDEEPIPISEAPRPRKAA